MNRTKLLIKVIDKIDKDNFLEKLGNLAGFDFECLREALSLECEVDFSLYTFTFHSEFAKAYFGKEDIEVESINDFLLIEQFGVAQGSPIYDYRIYTLPAWQYHLQQYVILNDEERFKYLEKFL